MRQIPQNTIPKAGNYSDKLGDFVESFGLDLNDNYGSFIPTRMKKVVGSDTQSDIEIPIGFCFYNGAHRMVTDDFVYNGGNEVNDTFTKNTSSGAPSGNLSEANSDVEVFNGAMYVSGDTQVYKLNGSTWSTPVTTQLTANRPHLMVASGQGGNARLYITDDYDQIHSISTSDVISATGTATFDFQLGGGWSITMLEAGVDSIWVGFTDTESGRGLVYEWDGQTENISMRRIPLNAGVAAGCVVDGIPYIMDIRGRLLRYSGYTFTEVDKLPFKNQLIQYGAHSQTNLRFIHPNGMTATDRNTILMLVSNETEATGIFQDSVPSGIYEYDPQIGLHHKYAFSTSPIGATTFTDLGHQRLDGTGAIYFSRSTTPTTTSNGTILAGAKLYTGLATYEYGIFTNDTLKTTQGYAYFVTPKLYSSTVQDTWKEVYTIHQQLIDSADKIVVKYKTKEKNSKQATCYWLENTVFTTTDDISNFEVGDEVTILHSEGAGQTMHITAIEQSSSTYTVTVDENPLGADIPFMGLFQNFKKLGTETTLTNNKQWFKHTLRDNNVSPFVQIKVCLYLTNNEFHKIRVEHSENIN